MGHTEVGLILMLLRYGLLKGTNEITKIKICFSFYLTLHIIKKSAKNVVDGFGEVVGRVLNFSFLYGFPILYDFANVIIFLSKEWSGICSLVVAGKVFVQYLLYLPHGIFVVMFVLYLLFGCHCTAVIFRSLLD